LSLFRLPVGLVHCVFVGDASDEGVELALGGAGVGVAGCCHDAAQAVAFADVQPVPVDVSGPVGRVVTEAGVMAVDRSETRPQPLERMPTCGLEPGKSRGDCSGSGGGDLGAGAPDAGDAPGSPDVRERVAVEQDEVGAQAGFDGAAVVQTEVAGVVDGRGTQGLSRAHAGVNEQLELVMEAVAVRDRGWVKRAGRGVGVRPGQDRYPSLAQDSDGGPARR